LEQLLDFADTAGAMLLTQGMTELPSPVDLIGQVLVRPGLLKVNFRNFWSGNFYRPAE